MIFYAAVEELEDGSKKPVGEIPPCVFALEFDANAGRFVLLCERESSIIPSEWVPKSEQEVELDYPGLLGGA